VSDLIDLDDYRRRRAQLELELDPPPRTAAPAPLLAFVVGLALLLVRCL
jgi:hypothetical protein